MNLWRFEGSLTSEIRVERVSIFKFSVRCTILSSLVRLAARPSLEINLRFLASLRALLDPIFRLYDVKVEQITF